MKISLKIISAALFLALTLYSLSFTIFAANESRSETVDMLDFALDTPALVLSESGEISVTANETDARYGRSILSKMENAENLTMAYDLIAEGISNFSSSIYLSYYGAYISTDEFTVVYNTVMCDFPEYIWLGTECSYALSFNGTYITYIAPTYIMTETQAVKASAELESVIEDYTKDLRGKSHYKIAKTLHDRIALRTDYVDTANDQTAYGALVEKQAVCSGYARAYQILLSSLDIPVWTVVGTSLVPGSTTNVGHAWNIVNLDGKWYHTDITWDDQGNSANYIFNAYFNVTTAQIEEDHAVLDCFANYMPECSATELNYFGIKNWQSESFDLDMLIDSMKRGGTVGKIYVSGDVEDYTTALRANMYNVVKGLGITGTASYSMMILGREVRVILKAQYTANGDANGDLKTDLKDVLVMRRYLASMDEETEISILNADYISDSEITTADVLKLRRILSCIEE